MKGFFVLFLLLFITLSTSSNAQQVKVKVHLLQDYSPHEEFAYCAALALEDALNSPEFKEAIMQMDCTRRKGLNNIELYETIMTAHEKQGEGGEDGVVDLYLRTLRVDSDEKNWNKKCEIGSRSGTIGIDGKRDGICAICPQRLELWAERNEIALLAGHYAHEYMHILGFTHRILLTMKQKKKSFVYRVGYIVTEIVEKNIENGKDYGCP